MFSHQLARYARCIERLSCRQASTAMCRVSAVSTMKQTTHPCTPLSHTTSWTLSRRMFSDTAAVSEVDILQRIQKVLGEMERAKVDASKPLTAELSIADDVGLDSLDFVEFGIALEDEFGIEIDDDKADGIKTVGDTIKVIQQEMEAAALKDE